DRRVWRGRVIAVTPTLSFPRKRESKDVDPRKRKSMDSRLRGNDGCELPGLSCSLRINHGQFARWQAVDRLGDGADVFGGGAAAAADDVDQARLGELAQHRGHLFRGLVVLAKRVGQA